MDESITKHFEQQQVGTLKLSDAIRIGAKLRPQCSHFYHANGASCALGAAWEALTGMTYAEVGISRTLTQRFQLPFNKTIEIMNRNDAGQTREQIADWLEAQGY